MHGDDLPTRIDHDVRPNASCRQSSYNTRIFLDGNGTHNFDLRKESARQPRKLVKVNHRNSRSFSTIDSIETMHVSRSNSDTSDHGSFRRRFSSLVMPGTSNGMHKSNSNKSKYSATSQEAIEDVLPETKKELEVVLNYHLSELDLLKRNIATANDMIRAAQDRFEIFVTRATPNSTKAVQMQWEMVQQAMANRDTYSKFVQYHNSQLERIKHRRIEIERSSGLEPSLPEVFGRIWKSAEWDVLFSVGR